MGSNYVCYKDNGDMIIRKSMMSSFEFCPLQFKKSWPVPGSGLDEAVDKDNYIMRAGSRFHDFADKFFDYCYVVPIDNWEDMIPPEFAKSEVRMAKYFIGAERKRYETLQRENRLDEFHPVLREQFLRNDDIGICGSFDRMDWWDKEEDEMTVIEYKSGQGFYLPSIQSQLAFYAIMWATTINDGNITHMTVINPRLRVTKSFKMNEKLIEKVLGNIIKIHNAIKNEGPYPAKCTTKKHAVCHMCDTNECGLYKKWEGLDQ